MRINGSGKNGVVLAAGGNGWVRVRVDGQPHPRLVWGFDLEKENRADA